MEVKLLPHAKKVEIEFRLLQSCVGTFIFQSLLPVLPHERLLNKFSSDPSLPTLLLLLALLFARTFRGHQHLFSLHVELHWSVLFALFPFSGYLPPSPPSCLFSCFQAVLFLRLCKEKYKSFRLFLWDDWCCDPMHILLQVPNYKGLENKKIYFTFSMWLWKRVPVLYVL